MAWRIDEQVVRGELDCRAPERIQGTIWLIGRAQPLTLDLEGKPSGDLAGCLLAFENPCPKESNLDGLAAIQRGSCGEFTASRKYKVPTVPLAEWLRQHPGQDFPHQLATGVYLEWFSDMNGRVVIESTKYRVSVSEAVRTTDEESRDTAAKSASRGSPVTGLGLGSGDAFEARPEDDPEITALVDSTLRIQELRQEVERITNGEMITGSSGSMPAELEEQFWRNVLAFESAPRVKLREILAANGAPPPPASLLSDEEIHQALWQLIDRLARQRHFLEFSDHLSDRELYGVLTETIIEDETEAIPAEAGWNCHHDLTRYGGQEDPNGTTNWLRYYADEETRRRWTVDFPGEEIPPHDEPPFNRDRHLPRPPEYGI